MPRTQLNCRVPQRTRDRLAEIARNLPCTASGMPMTVTDALIVAVDKTYTQMSQHTNNAADGRQGE